MPPSRRDDLVDAAMRVFYSEGFHSTGIDRVLREAGVSRMTLYNHFRSKDELIVAALRRRDEIFRNALMKYVDGQATEPRARILALFDFLEGWFAEGDFCGCMFVNAAAEFGNADGPIRRLAAEHKRLLVDFLREQCVAAGFDDPETLAEQINILVEGAINTAHVIGSVSGHSLDPAQCARLAKAAAQKLIEASAASCTA